MHPRAGELIERLDLKPHPENGFYREVFRSAPAFSVAPVDGRGERAGLTTIYYLLADGAFSRWHRVTSDEAWHFYEGDALELVWLEDEGSRMVRVTLGPVSEGSAPVAVVPAGCWQACRTSGYTLAGCSVGPGFDFADFTMLSDSPAEAAGIAARFPDAASLL
jgi:predicted cupin superfamily sugar epimerase